MTGFEAISAHNGWAQALVGACIVFSGLAVLSFTISQLHKIVALIEKKNTKKPVKVPAEPIHVEEEAIPDECPADIEEAAALYQRISANLGESFQLVKLYKAATQKGLPHPHITITCLRNTEKLVTLGDGEFIWKKG